MAVFKTMFFFDPPKKMICIYCWFAFEPVIDQFVKCHRCSRSFCGLCLCREHVGLTCIDAYHLSISVFLVKDVALTILSYLPFKQKLNFISVSSMLRKKYSSDIGHISQISMTSIGMQIWCREYRDNLFDPNLTQNITIVSGAASVPDEFCLPLGVISLRLNFAGPEDLLGKILSTSPQSLQRIEFGRGVDVNITQCLSDTIIELVFEDGSRFNQDLSKLPPHLRTLQFGRESSFSGQLPYIPPQSLKSAILPIRFKTDPTLQLSEYWQRVNIQYI